MLILSRYPDQRIILGNGVTITVLGFQGGQVRLGIKAPKEVTIDREEVAEAKARDIAAGLGDHAERVRRRIEREQRRNSGDV